MKKDVHIQNFSCLYFPVFGLYLHVSLRIQCECGKNVDQKTHYGHFWRSIFLKTGISRENIIRKIFVYFFIDFFVDFNKNRTLGMRSYSNCSRVLLIITISDLPMILYLHHCSEVNIRQYSNVKN